MNRRTGTAAAVAAAIFLGGGTAAVLTGCSGGAAGSKPSTTITEVQQAPMAADIARQLHGTGYTELDLKEAKVLWGMTSGGTFWLSGQKYAINVFTTTQARDRWLETARQYGVNPRWMGPLFVAYPSLMP